MSPFDEGATLYEDDPELLLAEVWRKAAKLHLTLGPQRDFVSGYVTRRLRKDEFLREKNSAP